MCILTPDFFGLELAFILGQEGQSFRWLKISCLGWFLKVSLLFWQCSWFPGSVIKLTFFFFLSLYSRMSLFTQKIASKFGSFYPQIYFIYMKGRVTKWEKEIFHPPVYLSCGYSGLGWTKLNSAPRNPNLVFHVGGRAQVLAAFPAAFSRTFSGSLIQSCWNSNWHCGKEYQHVSN